MKKSIRTIMAFLTALTVMTGSMGTAVFAEEAGTGIAVSSENTVYNGVFSEGAEYRFLSGADALIIDGEGSFTAEEFSELAAQFSPRSVVLGDDVLIPDSENANNEWLYNMLTLSSPYAVYTHKNSKTNESLKKLIAYLENEIKAAGMDPYEVKVWIRFQLNLVDENEDFYNQFSLEPQVAEKADEMDKYLIENGIKEDIAREVSGYYLYGLKCRIDNRLIYPDIREVANPDGTEVNESTIEGLRRKCLLAAQCEQDLLEEAPESAGLDNRVSKLLAENGVTGDDSTRISLMYVTGSKSALAFSIRWVRDYEPNKSEEDENVEIEEKESAETVTQTNPVSIKEDETAASEIAAKTESEEVKSTVKGDVDGDGELTVRDAAFIAKAFQCGVGDTLPENADFNGDGIVSVRDAAEIAKHFKREAEVTLKGDADLSGALGLADAIVVSKFNLNSKIYPLANITAMANADMNDDGVVDSVDCNMLIEANLGN